MVQPPGVGVGVALVVGAAATIGKGVREGLGGVLEKERVEAAVVGEAAAATDPEGGEGRVPGGQEMTRMALLNMSVTYTVREPAAAGSIDVVVVEVEVLVGGSTARKPGPLKAPVEGKEACPIEKVATLVGPSIPPDTPKPASVRTTPEGSIARTAPAPESATRRFPA